MKALSVALSTSPTAVMRFLAFSVSDPVESVFGSGTVKLSKYKVGTVHI